MSSTSLANIPLYTDEEKIAQIEHHFASILDILGVDLTDPSTIKTPHRVAKMYVKELFSGLEPSNFPKITTQPNSFNYNHMLVESNIAIQSVCEHHFVPILGVCHIAYIPGEKVIGLSKLNRVAQYFARRPQVQERLTKEIKQSLVEVLETEDVAVVIDAIHLCVRMRGVQDHDALTRTMDLGGIFRTAPERGEFLLSIPTPQELKL